MRRTDKLAEAKFFELTEYMAKVDEFFEIYFLKNPHETAKTRRTVYVASDDAEIFKQLTKKYCSQTALTCHFLLAV